MAHPTLNEIAFDKEGNAISLQRWGELFQDMSYRRVGLYEPDDSTRVSTVWLGIPHGHDPMGPLIFETLANIDGEEFTYRYPTLERAIAKHQEIVDEIKEERGLPDIPESTKDIPSRWEQIADELDDE